MKAKQRPILEPMVDAILSGGKTQFRTVITPQPVMYDLGQCEGLSDTICDALVCPHGKTGDILWVLEDHYQYGHWEEDKSKSLKHGKTAWKFIPDTNVSPRYGEDAPDQFKHKRCPIDPEAPFWYKGKALFMPKSIARLWMEIVSQKIERLHRISDADSFKEGILTKHTTFSVAAKIHPLCFDYSEKEYSAITPRYSFQTLWQSSKGEQSWKRNPWVWVIEFKLIENPNL